MDTPSNLPAPGHTIRRDVPSADGVRIVYELTGSAPTALVFAHGWLGSGRWWDAQRDAFSDRFTVVQLDLASHGASGRDRVRHSAEAYAADIVAVVRELDVDHVVIVGHSMSGVHGLIAANALANVEALVLVDTLKNVEEMLPAAQVDEMLALCRRDFRAMVERVLPQWFFAPGTPAEVSSRLRREFLERTGGEGAALLEPVYRVDPCPEAAKLRVPVRAINSDLHPTDVEANRRHFRDYAMRLVPGTGHYPMLEAPDAFDQALRETLAELKLLP